MGANRETLIGHFDTGDRPTEPQMHNLINSTINIEEGTSQYISDIFCLASGSQDFFHQMAPPFVPHLQPHIKVVNFDTHTGLSVSGSSAQEGGGGIDAIATSDDDVTSMFRVNSPTIAFNPHTSTDFPNGGFSLAIPNDPKRACLSTTIRPFRIQQKNPIWLKTKIQLPDVSGQEFFFGMSDSAHNTPVFNPLSVFNVRSAGIRWNKTTLTAAFSNTVPFMGGMVLSGCEINLTTTIEDNDVLNVGIIWNGIDKFYYYTSIGDNHLTLDSTINVQQITDNSVSSTVSALPTIDDNLVGGSSDYNGEALLGGGVYDATMGLVLYVNKTSAGSANFEYIQGAIKTNTF